MPATLSGEEQVACQQLFDSARKQGLLDGPLVEEKG
jgi:hypothetical protein